MQYLLANGQNLRIREAVSDDAAALLEMFRVAVKETDFLMTTPAEAEKLTLKQEKAFISTYEKDENQLFLVAEVNKRLIGSTSLSQNNWKKQQHVSEFGIVVLRDYWNMGVARRMMHHVFQWVEEHPKVCYVHLSVIANNEKALHIYQHFGFEEEGRKHGAIRQHNSDYQDVILMGKWIDRKGN